MVALQRPAAGRAGTVVSNNPLGSEEKALLFSDGWISIAWADPYRVDWRSPNGHWIRGSPLPFEAVALNNREKCAALQRWALTRSSSCDPSILPGWPRTIPPFLPGMTPVLLAAPDGRLVVARTSTLASPGKDYDIVDRQGKLAGRIRLRQNEVLIGFGVRSAYVLVTDDLGLQTIQRHPWP
jgi:hypothetical protein